MIPQGNGVRISIWPILAFIISGQLLFFTNCAPTGFEVSESSHSLSSTSESGHSSSTPEPSTPTTLPAPPPPGSFTLQIAKSGSGSVISNPMGISCGDDCYEPFPEGTTITLIATPVPGFVFKGWTGACHGTNTTCTLTMNRTQHASVSFESIAGTPESIDAVIAAMPANSWKALPGTQMKAVCPTPFNSYACWAVVGAWSGGSFDEKRERMIIFGGGHADSWYNNIFAFDLTSMKWLRLSEMPGEAGEKPPPGWTDIRTETCGYYTKGIPNFPPEVMKGSYVDHAKCFEEPVLSQLDLQQPRSPHTYGGIFVDRLKDRYCSLEGNGFPSGQAVARSISCFDPKTGQWGRIADRPMGMGGLGQTALDSFGHIWSLPAQNGYISEYDPGANAWKTYGYSNYESGGGMDIDRKRNQLYVLYPETGRYLLRRWDLTSPTSLKVAKTYSDVPMNGDAPTNIGNRPGFVYADVKDLFYTWGGGRNIYTLDPTTGSWQILAPTGDDPGQQQSNGTYGRFRYVPSRSIFILVNDTNQNVFIYKPK